MTQPLIILGVVFQIARWGLLVSVCLLLYRRFSIRSLPWLAAHYAIALPSVPVIAYLFKHSIRESHASGASIDASLVHLSAGSVFLRGIVSFLIVALVLGEVAHFVFT